MMANRPFSEFDQGDVKTWDLPYVEDKDAAEIAQRTNALNKRSDWKYEPPEEEEEVLPPTAEEIEAIRQAAQEEGHQEGYQKGFEEGRQKGEEEGRESGHQEGYEAGHQEGLDAGKQAIDTQAEQWQQLINHVHSPLNQLNDETREQMVKLAVALARAVIRTEVTTSEAVILKALSEGLSVLPVNENTYRIHMHPDDIELVTAHYGDDVIKERGWQLVASDNMQRGGCDITTTHNAVDVSIERRCRDVLDKFLTQQGLSDD
ncbi:flagellar assembly protein FliH [Alteromonas sp. CYL-A6]|uniref:flagellar assembly protein FliH n=1 Tax=Alteromonas nitratireducens TaxID=3390813 RepID=UPI0034A8B822